MVSVRTFFGESLNFLLNSGRLLKTYFAEMQVGEGGGGGNSFKNAKMHSAQKYHLLNNREKKL